MAQTYNMNAEIPNNLPPLSPQTSESHIFIHQTSDQKAVLPQKSDQPKKIGGNVGFPKKQPTLKQQYSTGGNFSTLGEIWQDLETFLVSQLERLLLVSSRQRAVMPLYVLQGTEQLPPEQRIIQPKTSVVLRLRNSTLEKSSKFTILNNAFEVSSKLSILHF